MTCEQNRIIKKCTSSCLLKVTRSLKLQTLYQTLERAAGHSPETQGGWPQVRRKTLRLRMQQNSWCSCMYHTDPASVYPIIDREGKGFKTSHVVISLWRPLFDSSKLCQGHQTSCKDWQIHDSIPSNSWWIGAPWFVLLLFVGLTWRKGDTSS